MIDAKNILTMRRGLLIKLTIFAVAIIMAYYWWQSYRIERNTRFEFFASIPIDLSLKPVTSQTTCACNRTLPDKIYIPKSSDQESTCDYYATLRGYHQNVISFSLYGQVLAGNNYFKGIQSNLKLISKFYPDWLVRVYHSVNTDDENSLNALCQLWCDFPKLDFCQVGRLPSPLGDQSQINGMLWRFFTLGDPLVDRFMFRDLDSVPSAREAAAVADWLQSNFTWHFMHDHPLHNVPILGGMWGGLNKDLRGATKLRNQFIENGLLYAKGSDSILLEKFVLPIALKSDDYIDHSSYLCKDYFKRSLPWPTRRLADLDYVGRNVQTNQGLYIDEHCPESCRPANHLDWVYC